MDTLNTSPVIPTRSGRPWLLPVAAAALIAVGTSAGVLIGRHSAAPAADASPVAAASTADTPAGTRLPVEGQRGAADTTGTTPAAPGRAATAKPAPHRSAAAEAPTAGTDAGPALDTRTARAVPVCASCGVVESVKTEVQQGDGSGVGAVAGGVVGGLLGNQMGKGNGRAAMTVLGALGGGVAGNAIEKHQRARTVYGVAVRMDDGTLRRFTRSEPWSVGQRVTVDGSALRASADAAPAHERTLRTSGTGLSS